MVTARSPLFFAAIALSAWLFACAHSEPLAPALPDASLVDPSGGARSIASITSASRFTVMTFWSAHCPCQRAHDGRLRALYDAYAPRGVAFVAVDSEVAATEVRDAAEAKERVYPFPLFIDRGGALARALGAEYATYTVILDDHGAVVYRGGLDDDRTHLTESATAYVREALDDLLAGRAPRVAKSEALGCTLQLR